jgi:hypothetical protein
VIDSVTKIESGPEAPAGAILDHLDQGGGLLCAGLARLYAATLVANGQEARVVSLSRNFPDRSDSHTTVEVRQDGRWVIFDPTFNLSFIREGVLQGAEEIHRALIDGTASEIHVVRYPPGRYPGRLERQAVHWLPLFNNVYALDPSEGWLAKLPPPAILAWPAPPPAGAARASQRACGMPERRLPGGLRRTPRCRFGAVSARSRRRTDGMAMTDTPRCARRRR